MRETIIKAENVGKLYKLGEIGTGTISHDLNRWLARIRGKEDPLAKVGEINDRTSKGNSDYVWALQNVNFEVKQGEVLGIIGRNGAGKSTLLKILSKVTTPSTGQIKIKGRIASLLEVGTGFHPELTGRENIFLNGAVLGMTKHEIRKKFSEIIDFAGVERYIDTPVKRYSSGMYVRLAFAVAAFLEPEILIIDEVLAVGDAEFQMKCLGRMKDVSANDGRTVLFVSHNMAAVQSLCTSCVLMQQGTIKYIGDVSSAISKYRDLSEFAKTIKLYNHKNVFVSGFKVDSHEKRGDSVFAWRSSTFSIEVTSTLNLEGVYIGVGINDIIGGRLFTLFSKYVNRKYSIKQGINKFYCDVPEMPLKPGIYTVEIYVGDGASVFDYYNQDLNFEVFAPDGINHNMIPDESQGSIIVKQNWT
jgi:lipopolysaccharide transport system ATP-binding protein